MTNKSISIKAIYYLILNTNSTLPVYIKPYFDVIVDKYQFYLTFHFKRISYFKHKAKYPLHCKWQSDSCWGFRERKLNAIIDFSIA